MLIYSMFMLVESSIMLTTMLTVVAKITKRPHHLFLADMHVVYQWPLSDSDIGLSSDMHMELAGVDLEPTNVTSSGQRSLLDVPKPASKSDLSSKYKNSKDIIYFPRRKI